MYKTRVRQVKSPCLINKPAVLLTFSLPADVVVGWESWSCLSHGAKKIKLCKMSTSI